MSRPRIVIVGAGFAGYRAAGELSRKSRGKADITLLNPTDYFLCLPLLPQVAAGILEPRRVTVSLAGTLPHVRLVLGEADGVDLDGRTVHCTGPEGDAGTLPCDRLVLAVGGVDKLRMGTSLKEATPNGVLLTDGEFVETRTLVWCEGVQPDPLVESTGQPLQDGRLVVDPYLQLPGTPEVFACGDAAAVPDMDNPGSFTPMTAQHAWRHGAAVPRNVAASLGVGERGRSGHPRPSPRGDARQPRPGRRGPPAGVRTAVPGRPVGHRAVLVGAAGQGLAGVGPGAGRAREAPRHPTEGIS